MGAPGRVAWCRCGGCVLGGVAPPGVAQIKPLCPGRVPFVCDVAGRAGFDAWGGPPVHATDHTSHASIDQQHTVGCSRARAQLDGPVHLLPPSGPGAAGQHAAHGCRRPGEAPRRRRAVGRTGGARAAPRTAARPARWRAAAAPRPAESGNCQAVHPPKPRPPCARRAARARRAWACGPTCPSTP